jgi:hypothetical protein
MTGCADQWWQYATKQQYGPFKLIHLHLMRALSEMLFTEEKLGGWAAPPPARRPIAATTQITDIHTKSSLH